VEKINGLPTKFPPFIQNNGHDMVFNNVEYKIYGDPDLSSLLMLLYSVHKWNGTDMLDRHYNFTNIYMIVFPSATKPFEELNSLMYIRGEDHNDHKSHYKFDNINIYNTHSQLLAPLELDLNGEQYWKFTNMK